MKITTLLLITSLLGLHANEGYSQKNKITINIENASLQEVIDAIELNSQFNFVYKTKDLDLERKLSIQATNEHINNVLRRLFKNTSVDYNIRGIHITLKQIEEEIGPDKRAIQKQSIDKTKQQIISGIVTDKNGIPLPGANIVEKGTSNGVTADFDGKFSIQINSNNILVISYIGYLTKEIPVDNQSNINILLNEDLAKLDEVVLIGYGTQKKSSLTAAVASIDSEELQKQVSPDVALSVQGRTPGVEVVTQGGIAGAEAKIIIRGAGSFSNTEPLYVIDGAISNSGLRNLNPNDINSIEILKDGAAAAIYGVRAANGVVLVTTKTGKTGKVVFQLNTSTSMQSALNKLDYLDASEYTAFANMVSENSSLAHAPNNDNPDSNIDTDWQELWLRSAPMQTIDVSASGGSDSHTFRLSAGYLKQDGILEYSSFDKYTFRVNNSFEKNKFTLHQNLGITRYATNGSSNSIVGGLIPTVPVYDGNGNLISGGPEYFIEGDIEPNRLASAYYNELKSAVSDITGSLNLGYELIPGLKYQLRLGGNYRVINNYSYTPTYYTLYDGNGRPDARYGNALPDVSETRGEIFNYTIDNTLNYNRNFGKHSFDVLLGTSWTREFEKTLGGGGFFSEFSSVTSFNGEGNVRMNEQGYALLSYFGRLNYEFDDKYLISATLRRDETSQFSSENNLGYFPSISAGWNIHNEGFFDIPAINQFKIRGGYGELGVNSVNQRANFVSTAYGPIPAIFGNNSRVLGTITRLANQDLTWETSKSTNLGVDMRFLDNTMRFTGDYFIKENVDLLAQLELLPSAGQTVVINSGTKPFVNAPTVRNKGLELSLGYSKYEGDFTFDVDFNISAIKNEVLDLGENIQPIRGELISDSFNDRPTITKAGLPIGSFIGYVTEGIDENGDFIFQDNNGLDDQGALTGESDGKIDENDKVILGDPFPDFNYGFNFSGKYKSFDFTLFIQGVQGNEIFSQIKYPNYFLYNSALVSDVLNSWTPSNTNTTVPIAKIDNRNGGNALPSDFYIEDGSYLRLKNIQIGYNFSNTLTSKLSLSKLRIYAGAQNLFTITDYSGYDPEVSSNVLFNRGVDYRGIPNARTLSVGLNATF